MAKKKTTRKKAASSPSKEYTVHLIAAGAGELLNGLASVVITQFPEIQFRVVSHPLQDSIEKLEKTLTTLTNEQPIVLHALADEAAKLVVRNTCVVRHIPHFDVTGQLVSFFSDCVGKLPQNDVSRLHQLDSEYQRRIEAMEFALEHDDSLGLQSLRKADVVIVGVSRVSKTPTTIYLGSRGYRAANVSISPETGFPPELSKISKKKIVALTTQPKRLWQTRADRAKSMGIEGTPYDDLRSITRELMDAEAEYKSRGYNVIDVTELTIEQVVAQIIDVLHLRAK